MNVSIHLRLSSDLDWLAAEGEGRLMLEPLNLRNGSYVMSVSLYKTFDPELLTAPEAYDWIDRSVEFQVVGTTPAITSVCRHPARWSLECPGR